MSTLITIGGPSRAGKTTIFNELLQNDALKGYGTVDWDAMKHMFSKSFGEANAFTPSELANDTPEAERQRDIDKFNLMRPYIKYQLDHGRNIIAEGRFRAIYDYSVFAPHNHIQIYLVRRFSDIDKETEIMKRVEESDPSGGWLIRSGWNIRDFVKRHRAPTEMFYREAIENGKKVFDASEWDDFFKMKTEAVNYILGQLAVVRDERE